MFDRDSRFETIRAVTAMVGLLLGSFAAAEIIHLKNGDVIHGTVVDVMARGVTVQTPYGKLTIPKTDILRIEYEGGGETQTGETAPAADAGDHTQPVERGKSNQPPSQASRPLISIEIRGRAFWYAFDSPPDNPADLSIRMRLFLGSEEAAMILDSTPDTYDGNTYYNSFTFSPSDSQVARTGDGYECEVVETEDGRILVKLELPEGQKERQILVRMLYQINEGSRSLPRWNDIVSRAFSVRVKPGQEAYVVVRQDSSGLDYSGFLRKSMKNLESFQLDLLSAELRDISNGPKR